MKRPAERLGAMALAVLLSMPAAAMADDGWGGCWWGGDCDRRYLNITTRQGNATLSIGYSCLGAWRHVWGRPDARGTISQWLNADAAFASGSLCVELPAEIHEVRVISMGGHCGQEVDGVTVRASKPGGNTVLRRAFGAGNTVSLPGCHVRMGIGEDGAISHGGIALDFADGYGFGDSYARGFFYSIYDGFGARGVRPFGVDLRAIGEFNTYHYRIEIPAMGHGGWWWMHQGE